MPRYFEPATDLDWKKKIPETRFRNHVRRTAGLLPEDNGILGSKEGGKTRAATLADAACAGDVLLLATPWPATQQILAGLDDLNGKILIDATNPLLPNLSGLTHGNTNSGGEQVATWAGGAKVVKAFNTVGAKSLIGALGFEAVDAGPLTQARLLEPFALLWISMALVHGLGRDFAFQLLRR
jgi:8-hydroxy-5-deazaflavin:NADPH oxidoreductase